LPKYLLRINSKRAAISIYQYVHFPPGRRRARRPKNGKKKGY